MVDNYLLHKRRTPYGFFQRYAGPVILRNADCEIVRFSQYIDNDEVVGVGLTSGKFVYGHIRGFTQYESDENVDPHVAVMVFDGNSLQDITFISKEQVALLSMGGGLRVADLNTTKPVHSFSLESHSRMAFNPDYPNIFTVGDRAGNLETLDLRTKKKCLSVSQSLSATPGRKIATPSKRKANTVTSPTATLTAIQHIGEKYFACSSSAAEKGIRIWDMRYVKSDTPVLTLQIPAYSNRKFGVYSMCMDRSRTRLLAGCTDGLFRLYAPLSADVNSISVFGNGQTGDFRHSIFSSPITDHFIGPLKQGVGIWDFEKLPFTNESNPQPPSFYFKNCGKVPMMSGDWIKSGRYIGMVTSGLLLADRESIWSQTLSKLAAGEKDVAEIGFPWNVSMVYKYSVSKRNLD